MKRLHFALATLLLSAACGEPSEQEISESSKPELGAEEQRFSSEQATLLTFDFDGELLVPGAVYNPRSAIDEQMLYTMGHLNGTTGVGRLDALALTNVRTAAQPDGTTKVSFHARLPVAWGSKTSLPASYTFVLPRTISAAAAEAFTLKYKAKCVEAGAHDVDSGSLWYYYRPSRTGCLLASEDVVKLPVTVARSTENTTGKYPEYHKVWEDGALEVVAIFGKYEDGTTTASDAGIAGYARFIAAVKSALSTYSVVTVPTALPVSPGVDTPDITISATLPDGRKVKVTALLVDNVRTAPASFYSRYEALTPSADVIVYNGHAGLGANVRALARAGRFLPGRHLTLFMNGCDTFAYVDGSLAQARAAINSDDPTGTRYMEIITNAMPAYFNSMPEASMALINGLMKVEAPLTYEKMFAAVSRIQVVVVTGEEDNVYYPGYQPGTGGGLTLNETASVGKGEELRYQTAPLAPGKYLVSLAHDPAHPGGNANLYVKTGMAPTTSNYTCRSVKTGTVESCTVTLTSASRIHVGVVGAVIAQSWFVLTSKPAGAVTPPGPTPWSGITQQGTLAKAQELRFSTGLVPAGKYVFTLSGTGDADLYVRAAQAPTTASWDCRPYESGSAEQCTLTLSTPDTVHLMVKGYAASSQFKLVGATQP